jgi:predicted nucleic acid-binding protein
VKATVLDSSAAASWVLPDEMSDQAMQLYLDAALPDSSFHVPLLWQWEMGNVLLLAERGGRITPGSAEAALQRLAALRLQFDAAPDLHRQSQILRLAQAHELGFCDAAYLELVLRLNGQLASRDRKLLDAAAACGIVCLSF